MSTFEVPVERSKIREFAAAAKSTNPAYDGRDAVVPPTFLTVGRMSWQPPEESIVDVLGFDMRRVLHAEEEFVFHGPPPRAGVVLTASNHLGDTYEKEGRRGGTLRFGSVRTEFRGPDGTLVAEQQTTFVETARPPKEEA